LLSLVILFIYLFIFASFRNFGFAFVLFQMQQMTNCFEQVLAERDTLASDLSHAQHTVAHLKHSLALSLASNAELHALLEDSKSKSAKCDSLEKEHLWLCKQMLEWQNYQKCVTEHLINANQEESNAEIASLLKRLETAQEQLRCVAPQMTAEHRLREVENERNSLKERFDLLEQQYRHQQKVCDERIRAVEKKYKNILILNAVLEVSEYFESYYTLLCFAFFFILRLAHVQKISRI
jgi:cysteinyl-tRNA synthetase